MQKLSTKNLGGASYTDLFRFLDNLGDGVSIIDSKYRILHANKKVEDIFGAACVGRACYEIYAGRTKPCFRCPVKQGFNDSTNTSIEAEGINGKTYLISHSKIRINDKVVFLQGFTDVTVLKAREETLRIETERIKDELISNVTHELRTPITIAKGAIELAIEEGEEERRNKLLSIGRNALLRQNNIVEDLMIAAKMESPDYELELKECDLAGIITATLAEHANLAEEKKVAVKTSIPKKLPAMMGDPKALKRALMNIIGNSIKFNKKGGEVSITLKFNAANFSLRVVDTGIGIRKEVLEKIFDRFYQADGSIARAYPGTGMGLNVAKRLIEAHGGEVRVKSEVGKGTEFAMIIPVNKAKEVEDE